MLGRTAALRELAHSRALPHTRHPSGIPERMTGSTREHAPKLCSACAGWTRSNAIKARPPAIQAHANPTVNQPSRLGERASPTGVEASSALRRFTNDIVCDRWRRKLLPHHIERSSRDEVIHSPCGFIFLLQLWRAANAARLSKVRFLTLARVAPR